VNYFDIILIIPLLWAGYKGFKKGLILEIFGLLALFVGIYVAIHFSDFAADILHNNMNVDNEYMPILSFAITFTLVVLAVYFLGKMIEKVVNIASLEFINKAAGVLFGVAKMTLILSVVLLIFNAFNEKAQLIPNEIKEESLLFEPLHNVSLLVLPAFGESEVMKKYDEWKESNKEGM
jgi:membrane protein required for colicin V production